MPYVLTRCIISFATFHHSCFVSFRVFELFDFFFVIPFYLFFQRWFFIATISSDRQYVVSVWYSTPISFTAKIWFACFFFDLYSISDGKRWSLWALIELKKQENRTQLAVYLCNGRKKSDVKKIDGKRKKRALLFFFSFPLI